MKNKTKTISDDGLVDRVEFLRQQQLFAGDGSNEAPKKTHKLLPARYRNRDFFVADLFDYAIKDDGVSMEAPIFSLSTKKDMSEWIWESKDGSKRIEVSPSGKGRATQFDKDVLIYVVSQMTEALNRGREDAKNRTVRFVVHDYLVATNRPSGGSQYKQLEQAFARLVGTTIRTNIKTGGQTEKNMFSLLGEVRIVEKSPTDEKMIAVEVTLSRWLFNAVQAHEVLTLHSDYFRLRKPLERKLYELARKHCGRQDKWIIGLELLIDKCGSRTSTREFRRLLLAIIESDTIPEYKIAFERKEDRVTFYPRNVRKTIA